MKPAIANNERSPNNRNAVPTGARGSTQLGWIFAPLLVLLSACQSLAPRPTDVAQDQPTRVQLASEPSSPAAHASIGDSSQAALDHIDDTIVMPAAAKVQLQQPRNLLRQRSGSPHGAYPSGCANGCCGGPVVWTAGEPLRCQPSPDEWLCNGGDQDPTVIVRKDWSVAGLQIGDAIAHYDTVDGHRYVEPSNEVCLYAPRFASVRKVSGVILHEQHQRSAGVELPARVNLHNETQIVTTTVQPLQPIRQLAINGPNSFREHTRGSDLNNLQTPLAAEQALLPYQDFLIIRRGTFDSREEAELSRWLQAAITWTQDTMLQVVLDGKVAFEAIGVTDLQSVHVYESDDKSRLRIVKVANKQNARSGDIVEFTLRFDNVGEQTIGNVTVIDSLSRRLEYVEDSQQCSLKADFFTQVNEAESDTLRWEIIDPLKVGEGGTIHFKCRVR